MLRRLHHLLPLGAIKVKYKKHKKSGKNGQAKGIQAAAVAAAAAAAEKQKSLMTCDNGLPPHLVNGTILKTALTNPSEVNLHPPTRLLDSSNKYYNHNIIAIIKKKKKRFNKYHIYTYIHFLKLNITQLNI